MRIVNVLLPSIEKVRMKACIPLLVVIFYCQLLSGQTRTFNGPSAIPDFTCTEYTLPITDIDMTMDANFGLEQICIDITHTYVGDLAISLRSPQGTEVLLTNERGGNGDNYTNTCFDGDVSHPSISTGTPPFTGSFLPEEALGLFNGGTESTLGSWVLKICDNSPGDAGTLNSFSLTFGNDPALVPSADNDDCDDATLITVNQSYTCTLRSSATLSGATNSGQPDNCSFGASAFDDDIWFSFVTSTADQIIETSNVAGQTADLIFQLLSGSCGSLTSVMCHDDPDSDFEVNNLTPGGTYYLRVASKSSGLNTTFDLCVREAIPDPPANDDCGGAVAVTVPMNGSCSPVAGSVAGATASGVASPCPDALVGNFNDDVWFSFQAKASILEFDLTNVQGTNTALDYQVLSGNCPDNLQEEFCFISSGNAQNFFVSGLTVNASYFLRIASFQTAPQNTSFDLCIKLPGASTNPHDNCSDAGEIPIAVGQTCQSTISGSLVDAQPSTITEGCSATIAPFNDDVWFTFVAQAASHDLLVSNISGGAADLIFEVLRGPDCGGLSHVLCHDDPDETIALTGLTMGGRYYVRIASFELGAQTTTFELCLKSNTPPPSNDECASATAITATTGGTCTIPVTDATLVGATASAQAQTCVFEDNAAFDDDVWFSFVAAATSHQVSLTNITGTTDDLIYEVLSGSCGSLMSMRCHDDPNYAFIVSGLTTGNTYYIRVASYPAAGQTTTFDICVHGAPAPPANDECASATPLTKTDTTCHAASATLVGATPSGQSETCGGSPFHNDIWFTFQASQPKQVIELTDIVDRPEEIIVQVSTGSCGSITQVACFDFPIGASNTTYTAEGLTPGTDYFIRIASYDFQTLNTTFNICIHDTIPDPPLNDECALAALITKSAGQSCTSSVSGTLLGATASNVVDCPASGGFDDDVWYRFVADEVSHVVAMANIAGSTQDLEVQVLEGVCTSLTVVHCHHPMTPGAATDFEVNGLSSGSTYYIRVASFGTGIQTTTFDICVHDTVPDPPTNDACASAETVVVSPGETCTSTVSSTTLGATSSALASSCGNSQVDVWYTFEAGQTSQAIELSSISGGAAHLAVQVLSGSCGALTEIACYEGTGTSFSFDVSGLTEMSDYYLRIMPAGGVVSTFDLCVRSVTSAGCDLIVTTNAASGTGSLRAMIDCAQAGDIISFGPAVYGQSITLDLPTINVDKNLTLQTNLANDVTLSNANAGNTGVLINIQALLKVDGLKMFFSMVSPPSLCSYNWMEGISS